MRYKNNNNKISLPQKRWELMSNYLNLKQTCTPENSITYLSRVKRKILSYELIRTC